MAAAKSFVPRSSKHQSASETCRKRQLLLTAPLRISSGISNSANLIDSPWPWALANASLIVQNRRNVWSCSRPSSPSISTCSPGVSTRSMRFSRFRRGTRSSTSTPRRPLGAMAINPWLPLWLTLKLTDAGSPPTTADGLSCLAGTNANDLFSQASSRQSRARSAARHRANRRRAESDCERSHLACSSSSSQARACASRSRSGVKSTWKTRMSSMILKCCHQPLMFIAAVSIPAGCGCHQVSVVD